MALINLLIYQEEVQIDWIELNAFLIKHPYDFINFFPVPKELGFDKNYFGIAITSNFTDKTEVLNGLSDIIQYLIKNKFSIIELYEMSKITEQNWHRAFDELLSDA